MFGCLPGEDYRFVPEPRLWVQFIVWATVHTSSILIFNQKSIYMESLPHYQRVRVAFRMWVNARRIQLPDGNSPRKNMLEFSLKCVGWIFSLVILHRILSYAVLHSLIGLGIGLQDFELDKQGIIPLPNVRDVVLRLIISFQWIWNTYIILGATHSSLALIFVGALGWDSPEEWPPLFGNIAEAYSLRRFWGVFWHRLHIIPLELLMPSFLSKCPSIQGSKIRRLNATAWVKKFRALWVFTLSGLCHIIVNKIVLGHGNTIPELRFFVSNFCICLLETALQPLVFRWTLYHKTVLHCLGYIWVLAISIDHGRAVLIF
ncbi:membrane bound O-acyl transferase family-domain-containing protein [Nemania sp. FL0031]|nr:membrane bound O-acyl transferase family-domain-containing protein [Nemania sp. FL0031]